MTKRFLNDGTSLAGHGALRSAPEQVQDPGTAAWFDAVAMLDPDTAEQVLALYAESVEKDPVEGDAEAAERLTALAAEFEATQAGGGGSETAGDGSEVSQEPGDGDEPETAAPEGEEQASGGEGETSDPEETADPTTEEGDDDFAALAASVEDDE